MLFLTSVLPKFEVVTKRKREREEECVYVCVCERERGEIGVKTSGTYLTLVSPSVALPRAA
jgi:hypothetical protein